MFYASCCVGKEKRLMVKPRGETTAVIPADWLDAVPFLHAGAHLPLLEKQRELRAAHMVYPPEHLVFNALHQTAFLQVRVVIVGQDPYHGPGQAHGLAFSVPQKVKTPPSLRNMFKEIDAELNGGEARDVSTDLSRWARQGVLLLNTTLTVEAGRAASHAKLGWSALTDAIISALNDQREHLVFLLWGSHAQQKGTLVDRSRHCVLEAAHPSPLSAYRGFFGCDHFIAANRWLREHGQPEVEW